GEGREPEREGGERKDAEGSDLERLACRARHVAGSTSRASRGSRRNATARTTQNTRRTRRSVRTSPIPIPAPSAPQVTSGRNQIARRLGRPSASGSAARVK